MVKHLPQIKNKDTFSNKTYETLKKAIVELDLEPGMLITEEQLSEQLGVSRTPIRAALGRLVYDGLVEVLPGKRTIVAPLSEKHFLDLFSIREALEKVSFCEAARNRLPEDIESLEALLDFQDLMSATDLGSKESLIQFLKSDLEFHTLVARTSKNVYLENQITFIMNNISRYIFAATLNNIIPIVINEHRQMLQSIINGDMEAVSIQIKEHFDGVKMRALNNLKSRSLG